MNEKLYFRCKTVAHLRIWSSPSLRHNLIFRFDQFVESRVSRERPLHFRLLNSHTSCRLSESQFLPCWRQMANKICEIATNDNRNAFSLDEIRFACENGMSFWAGVGGDVATELHKSKQLISCFYALFLSINCSSKTINHAVNCIND